MDGSTAHSATGFASRAPQGLLIVESVRKHKAHQSLREPLTSPDPIQIECSSLYEAIIYLGSPTFNGVMQSGLELVCHINQLLPVGTSGTQLTPAAQIECTRLHH